MIKRVKTDIIPEDKEDFKQQVNVLKKNSRLNVLCSFTYITPNYDILATLSELHNFVKAHNFKVFLIMWDMNTLANPYFKKYCADKVKDKDEFIEEKMQEVRGIAKTMGFDDSNLSIYRSSDLWKRLVSFKKEDLIQQFFSVLARLPVRDFADFRKCSHIFQISLDLFFSNSLCKLYPEDGDEHMDIVFSDYYKKSLYIATRKIMIEEGIITNHPVFLLMETVPYIVYEERCPEWDMTLDEIKYILMHANNKTSEFLKLLNYFNEESGLDEGSSKDKILDNLAQELHKYLSKYKKLYKERTGEVHEAIMSISKKNQAIEMGSILKSRICLDILTMANGSHTITEIAKTLKKSVATISAYSKKLKDSGFISVDAEGKVIRKVSGIKLNFEHGL